MRCPQCGKEFTPGAKLSPFCSERCRLLDLGAWASERYRIAGRPKDDSEDAPDERAPKPEEH